MFKVRLREIIAATNAPPNDPNSGAFQRLMTSGPLPTAISWKLSRWWETIERERQRFFDVYNAAVKRYGEPHKDAQGNELPGTYSVLPENLERFSKELEDLQTLEIELWGDPISSDTLLDAVKEIVPADLTLLKWMLKEEPLADKTPSPDEAQPTVN